jgi:SAM-dependent methyltransferase
VTKPSDTLVPATGTLPRVPDAAALSSSEFGLALGLIFGRYFLDMQDLHYGYWPPELERVPQNLATAQAAYTELLMSHLPKGATSVLDVGCGAGNTARKLLDRGYRVDGVSPNSFLTAVARQVLRDRATIFETKFQDLVTDRRYDVVLFSESLLFIPLEQAFAKALTLLNPGGHILITDIFRVPAEGKSPIGGGHELPKFRETVARYPLAPVTDFDMTPGIAPTFDIVNRATLDAVEPAYRLILDRITLKYPFVMRLARWWFRKKILRYEQKHFSGRRDGANFMTYKSYRLLLFRRTDS